MPAAANDRHLRRLSWTLLTVLALGTSGCNRDKGPEQLTAAKERYSALVDMRANPDDPRFDTLMQELAAIPQDSSARAEADQLTRAIRGARRGPPMRPLSPVAPSTKPMSAEEARMQEVQSACARLAEQLGVAQEAERARLADALQRCREQLERAKVTHPHPEGGDGHDHVDAPGDGEDHTGHAHDGRKVVGDPAPAP